MPASLELVKIALQAYGNGDCEIAVALTGPHVRWDERASRVDGELVWGRDKVQRRMRRYLDSWEEYRFDVEDIAEAAPEKVVGICRERGKPKEGVAVDRRFGALWVVDGGKIVSWTTYLTPREAVRAAKERNGGAVKQPTAKAVPKPVQAAAPKPVELTAPEPDHEPAAEPPAEPIEADAPEPVEAPAAERSRRKILTKSEEQKRAARARAKLRRSSRQSA